jgi:DNA-binding transcriptional LysR family regulator
MIERSDISFADIVTFTAVAKTGSFTRAAERLGTNKSNVGKAVQRLEARLGVQLLQRTTRVVRLTEDGETYLNGAVAVVEKLQELEQSLTIKRHDPAGQVRLNLPASFGRLLLPTFAALRDRHPELTLELAMTDRMADPVAEGWDIVVRIGELPADMDMTVRKLGDLRFGLYASQHYLRLHGNVLTIDQLQDHAAIVFRGSTGKLRPWRLQDGHEVRELAPQPTLVMSDGQVVIDAVVRGLGISQLLDKIAQPYVAEGLLSHILPQCDVPGLPVHALVPQGHKMPAKTRAVLHHISEALR